MIKDSSESVKKFVITGGPCSGKTTLVSMLGSMGYDVMPEMAETIINEQLESGGDLVPWNESRRIEFQAELFERQSDAENNIAQDGLYFLDRAVPDGIAYCLFDGIKPLSGLLDTAQRGEYATVFLLGQVPVFENSAVRREDADAALKLSYFLGNVYRSLGYDVVDVASMDSPLERAEFILGKVREF
ncbi:MAG: ATP-binding protein [archaeon]|nr:ATP-binding protein [archaeon]